MTARTEKIASVLRREIAQTLQREVSDPRIEGMVSITAVKVSEDLRHATVLVSVLPKQNESKVIAALEDGTRHIQRQTQARIAMRIMPQLQFRLDDSLKKQAEVFAAIREATQRTGPPEPTDPSQESLR